MTALTKIVARKNKALNIFRVAKNDLTKVIADTEKAYEFSAATVKALTDRIAAQVSLQEELEIEKTTMTSTVNEIDKILGTNN